MKIVQIRKANMIIWGPRFTANIFKYIAYFLLTDNLTFLLH